MLLVVGTIPDPSFPLWEGQVSCRGSVLVLGSREVPVTRGTAALLAAAWVTLRFLEKPAPYACVAGDLGTGEGSRLIYRHLSGSLPHRSYDTICFHYLQPEVDWHNRVLFAIHEMPRRPLLIADAGFMYVAKMSGQAPEYDLFTPDVGELAFLADEAAPHPFYTRGFLLQQDHKVPELIHRAYRHQNAARLLLVKGETDYLANSRGIVAEIREPLVETLEPIGGTGDTLTGLVAALADSGYDLPAAALLGARANRLAGLLAHPTPASQVTEIIACLPEALREVTRAAPP